MANRGSFTFIAIIYTLVIVIVALSFSYYIKSRLYDISAFSTKTQAYLEIRSYINVLNFCLSDGQVSYSDISIPTCKDIIGIQKIPLDGTPVKLKDDLYVSVQDANGLLSLWSSDPETIKTLVMNVLGYTSSEADSFVNSLLDWIDTDDYKRINGAESFDYPPQGVKPRNYFFQYWQEPSFVKGIKPQDYYKIRDFVTILSNYGFNPNTAPAEVLSAYLKIDMQLARKVVEYRKSKNITNNGELFNLTGKTIDISKEGVYFFSSKTFVIKISSYKDGKEVLSASMGVNYKSGSYNIIYMNIN